VKVNEGAFSPTLNNPVASTRWAANNGTSTMLSMMAMRFIATPFTQCSMLMGVSSFTIHEFNIHHTVALSYHADFFMGNGSSDSQEAQELSGPSLDGRYSLQQTANKLGGL